MQHVSHLHKLPILLPSLTFENESNGSIRFLDIVLDESDFGTIPPVYRKSTFAGEYVRGNSFLFKFTIERG